MLQPDSPIAARVQILLARTSSIVARAAIPSFIFVIVMSALGSALDISGEAERSGGSLIITVTGLVAGFVLSRAMLGSSGLLHGDGVLRFGAYFGLSILTGLGVIFGLILLVVPGLLLLIRWLPAFGFLLGSGESATQALSSSWHRTKGHFWALLAGAVVPFLLAAAGGAFYVLVGMSAQVPDEALYVLANLALYSCTVAWSAYGFAAYVLLRDDADELSGVFG